MIDREIATTLALKYLGKPYIWGGAGGADVDPTMGFDCSGFVIMLAQAINRLPRQFDTTADGLFRKWADYLIAVPGEASLVFWGQPRIVHVEYCLNRHLSVGASGGGSSTLTVADAIEQDAYIKIRPWASRRKVAGFVNLLAVPLEYEPQP